MGGGGAYETFTGADDERDLSGGKPRGVGVASKVRYLDGKWSRQVAMIEVDKGLADVVVGETAISLVDGANGALYYRGRNVDELVDWPFAEVAAWVLTGRRGMGHELEAELTASAALSAREAGLVLGLPRTTHPMLALQCAAVGLDDSERFADYGEAAPGLAVAAKLPTLIATHLAGAMLPPNDQANGIDRFLAQIDAPGGAAARRAFETMQILQIEHGFNASTYAARVIASTLAPVQSVIAGAIGTLHGRLHGGADQAALEAADRVGSPDQAAQFVDACIARKQRVMGMGHREYRTLDPRAKHARRWAQALTQGTEHEATFETLAAIERRFNERMAERGKAMHANIEFYKGLIYRALGLPARYFTACFAMARVFGYLAHFMESRQDNRLIRPAVRYVGPTVAVG